MKKFLLMITMFFLITSKVQAVETSNYISLESTYQKKTNNVNFYNNLLNNYYGRSDIDLSEFTNSSTLISNITNGSYNIVMIPAPNNVMYVRISNLPLYFFNYSDVYTIMGDWAYAIEINNKNIGSMGGYSSNLSINGTFSNTNLTSEQFNSAEFQKSLLFQNALYYTGEIQSTDATGRTILNKQTYNKNTFWEYTEDGIYSYWSGDIILYDDYFELKNFETNVSDYSMYLLQYSVIENEFGEYILPNNYSYFEISKPNQGGTSTWQISNISDMNSGDMVYSIGIGTSDRPSLIRSEWFDSDENISDFMASNSFRLRYYVEDLPNFFVIDDNPSGEGTQRPSGDIANGVIDGNENYWGNQNDLTGEKQEELINGKIDELTEQISGDLAENEIFGILQTYEDKLFGGFTGEQDFKISWNDVFYMDSVIIPAGEINFSQICRENESLGRVKTTINIILGFMLLYNCVIYLYNLLLATLGIDNPYLYEKPQDVTTTSYSVDMNTGKTTETKTTKRKDGITFTTRRDI